jgi:transposase
MTIVEAARGVTGGVDTHLDVHVAAALDPLGGLLGTERFETNSASYKVLLAWLESFEDVTKVGIEGTGSYGSGLTRHLRRVGVEVIEVDRPNEKSAAAVASPIRSMLSRRLGPHSVAGRAAVPSPERVPLRPSGSLSWPNDRPARPGSRPSSRCVTSATAHLNSSVPG